MVLKKIGMVVLNLEIIGGNIVKRSRLFFMGEATIFIKEASGERQIQQIEQLINQMEGVERVLVDTEDGELKIEFDDWKISKDDILSTLEQNNYHQGYK
jgi:copper chaperone CopZ